MTALRGTTSSGPALALVTALTTWTAMLSWRGFSQRAAGYLVPLLLVAMTIALVGVLMRRFRLPTVVVVVSQLAAAFAFVATSLSGSPIPVGERWTTLRAAVDAAVASAQGYPAPVPLDAASLTPLLLPLGAACLLLTDVVACSWRRVPFAGLVLLTVYSIPVSVLGGGVSWWVFALTAGGFLGMLFLHEDEQISRWGRPLGQPESAADPTAFGVRTGVVRRSALGIGGAATALAVVLPVFIPTLHLAVFGGGSGPGHGEVHVENPIVDLRGYLRRGEDIPLVRLRTDDPSPTYLRIAVLTHFTDNQWSPGNRSIPSDQRATGLLPPLVGVDPDLPRQEYDYELTATDDFDSRWLPTMPQITQIVAAGDWRYDRSTMDFMGGEDPPTSTSGLSWSMTGVDLDLRAAELAAAPSTIGSLEKFTDLPSDFPRTVSDLAIEVTAEQPTRYQRAVALQDWFRTNFEYDPSYAAGNGSDDLVAFLDAKRGYCEQFAAAMAVMARSLGIPARVAIGFLRPDPVGPETWEYTAWDMHAWPELYFPGFGWVRFEPTPAARAPGTPGYTRQEVPALPGGAPSDSAGALPSDELPSRGSTSSADATPDAAGGDASGSGVAWQHVLLALLGVGGLTLLALVPRSLRRARRERRWAATGAAEAAWAELRDTMIDLGLTWPHGLSPRAAGERIASFFGRPLDPDTPDRPARGAELAPEATGALARVVAAVELRRYARPGTAEVEGLRADVETCADALYAGAHRRTRRRAAWLPRSVFRRTTPGKPAALRYDEVVDHAG
jgi:transglutaminase-like putative cysteine protease